MDYVGLIEGLVPVARTRRQKGEELVKAKIDLELPVNYVLVDSPLVLSECIDWLQSQEVVGFDLETTGLEWKTDKVVGLSFYSSGMGYYVPVGHKFAVWNVPLDLVRKGLSPWLQKGPVKVLHNAKFDRNFCLYHLGTGVNPVEDTLVLAHLYNENESHKLSDLSLRYLGLKNYGFNEVFGPVSFDSVDVRQAAAYAIRDSEACYLLWKYLFVYASPMLPLYTDLEMPLQENLISTEQRGIRIDEVLLRELKLEYGVKGEEVGEVLRRLAGVEINVRSSQQLANLLYTVWGLTPIQGLSTDEKCLQQLKRQGKHVDFLEKLLEYREYAKIQSTYIEGIEKRLVGGRLYPSFKQYGAVTGRLSCADPNLQNIPKDTGERKWRIRDLFLPDNGYTMIVGDYSQIEYRLLAHFSQEPMLLEAYAKGEDMHAKTAAEVLGIPITEVNRDQRHFGKTLNFALVYGLGPRNLAIILGVGLGVAKGYQETYFKRLLRVVSWRDSVVERITRDGYVETLMGRRRHLPKILVGTVEEAAKAERQGPNSVIQGSAADVMKRALVVIEQDEVRRGLDLQVLLNVHDEIVSQAPSRKAQEAMEREKYLCETMPELGLTVPLVFDVKMANWAEK